MLVYVTPAIYGWTQLQRKVTTSLGQKKDMNSFHLCFVLVSTHGSHPESNLSRPYDTSSEIAHGSPRMLASFSDMSDFRHVYQIPPFKPCQVYSCVVALQLYPTRVHCRLCVPTIHDVNRDHCPPPLHDSPCLLA